MNMNGEDCECGPKTPQRLYMEDIVENMNHDYITITLKWDYKFIVEPDDDIVLTSYGFKIIRKHNTVLIRWDEILFINFRDE